jgi:hypothetical protein
MRSETNFESFLKQWQAALRSPSQSWDGWRAVAELRSAGYTVRSKSSREEDERVSMFDFVLCRPAHRWRPRKMLSHILDEVENYKEQKQTWKEKYRETEFFLAGIERRVVLQSKRVSEDALKQLLKKTANLIEEQRRLVNNLKNQTQRSPLGVWERLWANHTRKVNIRREIELDTRLQLQIAKMFRTFLHKDEGVSLRTIARLVVLVYKVAGLAGRDAKNATSVLVGSRRTITCRSVEEILRRNRIDGQK